MVSSFRRYTENDIKTLKLKSLCRFRQNLKKSKARLKIQLTSYVDVIFPELQSFFKSGLHIKTCYELLQSRLLHNESTTKRIRTARRQ